MTKMAATRDGYGEALLELASNSKVVVLEADLGKSTKSLHFRKAHPERTVSCGIGEQNMLLVGAGLAASGYIPFASTFAIFTERAFEQMRNGVARPNLAVHVCGSHGGTHTGTDGSSAQSIEDLAIYRTLPNVIVMHPSDVVSTKVLTMQLASSGSPSYTRRLETRRRCFTKDAWTRSKSARALSFRKDQTWPSLPVALWCHNPLKRLLPWPLKASTPPLLTCTR